MVTRTMAMTIKGLTGERTFILLSAIITGSVNCMQPLGSHKSGNWEGYSKRKKEITRRSKVTWKKSPASPSAKYQTRMEIAAHSSVGSCLQKKRQEPW